MLINTDLDEDDDFYDEDQDDFEDRLEKQNEGIVWYFINIGYSSYFCYNTWYS